MFAPGQIFMDVQYISANSALTSRPTSNRVPIFMRPSAKRRKRSISGGAFGIGAQTSVIGTRAPASPCPECTKPFLAALNNPHLDPYFNRRARCLMAAGADARPDRNKLKYCLFWLLLAVWLMPLPARAAGGDEVVRS